MKKKEGIGTIIYDTAAEIARRPVCWIGFMVLPMLLALMFGTLMDAGLPNRIPSGIIDLDNSRMSRKLSLDISGMESVRVEQTFNSFSDAKRAMQEGKIYGYFLIPRNFQADLLAGRKPVISFYTNYTYYVPANLLFKTFKTTAVYTKASTITGALESVGMDATDLGGMLLPVNIVTRPLHNPQLNYPIYLSNSFLPCCFQLMIFIMTAYLLCDDMKYGFSMRNMRLAGGSVLRAVAAKLAVPTLIWIIEILFMMSYLFGWCHYPLNGSPWWIALSEVMFVLACQGFALFVVCAFPNLRMSLSVCALTGILSFSIGAFSFPVEDMYPAVGIFSWIVPTRYNFLIYIDQALNGIDIYYSRWWFVAYIIFMLLPLPLMGRLKRSMTRPVYAP